MTQTVAKPDFSLLETHNGILFTANTQKAKKRLEEVIREAGRAAQVFAGALVLRRQVIRPFVHALEAEGWRVA